MKNLTNEQINEELTVIRSGALTWEEYRAYSRVGKTFRMNRADRKEVYNLYLEQQQARDNKRASMLKNRLSKRGAYAYEAITKYRDEVMLVTA